MSYDYGELIDALEESVKKGIGLTLIEDATAGERPDYPFCSYSIISPFLQVTVDVTDHEVFETVLSFKIYTESSLQGLNLCTKLKKHFESFDNRKSFEDKNIVLVGISNVGKRDNFISIDYERISGFDIRLRVQDDYIDRKTQIENVEITEGN